MRLCFFVLVCGLCVGCLRFLLFLIVLLCMGRWDLVRGISLDNIVFWAIMVEGACT